MDIRPISIDDTRNVEVYLNMMLSVYRMLLSNKLKDVAWIWYSYIRLGSIEKKININKVSASAQI
jgi:hypothetical protein